VSYQLTPTRDPRFSQSGAGSIWASGRLTHCPSISHNVLNGLQIPDNSGLTGITVLVLCWVLSESSHQCGRRAKSDVYLEGVDVGSEVVPDQFGLLSRPHGWHLVKWLVSFSIKILSHSCIDLPNVVGELHLCPMQASWTQLRKQTIKTETLPKLEFAYNLPKKTIYSDNSSKFTRNTLSLILVTMQDALQRR